MTTASLHRQGLLDWPLGAQCVGSSASSAAYSQLNLIRTQKLSCADFVHFKDRFIGESSKELYLISIFIADIIGTIGSYLILRQTITPFSPLISTPTGSVSLGFLSTSTASPFPLSSNPSIQYSVLISIFLSKAVWVTYPCLYPCGIDGLQHHLRSA